MRDDKLQLVPCAKGSVTCKFAYGIQTGLKKIIAQYEAHGDRTRLLGISRGITNKLCSAHLKGSTALAL